MIFEEVNIDSSRNYFLFCNEHAIYVLNITE